jgi:site-specific DNA recombinase
LDRACAEPQPSVRLSDEEIEKFSEVLSSNIQSGSIAFRRAYIRSVVDRVEVGDSEVRILGSRATLETLVSGGGAVPSFV